MLEEIEVVHPKPYYSSTHRYKKEYEAFTDAQERKLMPEEAVVAVKKLTRHFKIPLTYVSFRGNRASGMASYGSSTCAITFGRNVNTWIVAHEVAHLLDYHKRRALRFEPTLRAKTRHGTKRWLRLVARVLHYGDKKGWWIGELARKVAAKRETLRKNDEKKAELTSAGSVVLKLEGQKKRWQTKLKRAATAIKKLDRRLRIWKKKAGVVNDGI